MYKIRLNSIDKDYEFDKEERTLFKGNLNDITNFALEEGLDADDLELAYKIMSENKHTIAEFGVKGYFIFSR